MQEYEEIKKSIGHIKYDAIGKYLEETNSKENILRYEEELKQIYDFPIEEQNTKKEELIKKYNVLFLSDILYKENQYKKFEKWFNASLKPFKILNINNNFSVTLDQYDFCYDWLNEVINSNKYGDGHCYNDLFCDYLENNYKKLNNRLNYDSENGMFCVYCENLKDAEEVSYILSNLYKNENMMIELIKDTKSKYGYNFESDINL